MVFNDKDTGRWYIDLDKAGDGFGDALQFVADAAAADSMGSSFGVDFGDDCIPRDFTASLLRHDVDGLDQLRDSPTVTTAVGAHKRSRDATSKQPAAEKEAKQPKLAEKEEKQLGGEGGEAGGEAGGEGASGLQGKAVAYSLDIRHTCEECEGRAHG